MKSTSFSLWLACMYVWVACIPFFGAVLRFCVPVFSFTNHCINSFSLSLTFSVCFYSYSASLCECFSKKSVSYRNVGNEIENKCWDLKHICCPMQYHSVKIITVCWYFKSYSWSVISLLLCFSSTVCTHTIQCDAFEHMTFASSFSSKKLLGYLKKECGYQHDLKFSIFYLGCQTRTQSHERCSAAVFTRLYAYVWNVRRNVDAAHQYGTSAVCVQSLHIVYCICMCMCMCLFSFPSKYDFNAPNTVQNRMS